MQKYSVTCTCGHKIDVEASNKEEAVVKMKEMMNQEAVDAHLAEFHKNDEVKPTMEQVQMMIEQTMVEEAPQGALA